MFSQRMRKISPGRRPESSMINSTEDRKSTRLNSSHLVISYAVFCLKKKKHALAGGSARCGEHLAARAAAQAPLRKHPRRVLSSDGPRLDRELADIARPQAFDDRQT